MGIILCALNLNAQDNKTPNEERYVIHIKKSALPIKPDGLLDEDIWKIADVAKAFFLNRPYDSSFAQLQTEARVAFDENFVYVGAVCYQPRIT